MAGYKRKRNGDAWQLIVTLGTDLSGKPRRYTKTVHCKNDKAADRELSRFFAECEDGFVNSASPTTVNELCTIYYNEYCENYLKQNTRKSHRAAINTWIKPLIGRRKVNSIKKRDIQLWVSELTEKGLSPKTIKNYFSVLDSIFRYAVEDIEIINANPCDRVKIPKQVKVEANYYNTEQVQTIARALESLPKREIHYKCAFMLALFCGLRKGEILGLNWDDINFETGEIYINRTRYSDSRGNMFVDVPKSSSSIRYVSAPDFLIADLKRLKSYQNELRLKRIPIDPEAVLHGDINPTMSPDTLLKRFNRLCDESNLPKYGLHALRHTQASMLAEMGVNIVQASKRLGHSKVSTTLDIYTHLFENSDRTIANQLDQYNQIIKESK